MLTFLAEAATWPTMPDPQGTRISVLVLISSTVELTLTSNKSETRHLESLSPCTINKEHLQNNKISVVNRLKKSGKIQNCKRILVRRVSNDFLSALCVYFNTVCESSYTSHALLGQVFLGPSDLIDL